MVVFKTLEELTKESALIVKGTITEIKPEWNQERTLIISYVTITIEKRYKGNTETINDNDKVVIKQIGGELEGYFTEVVGAPKFTIGEPVLLFLEPAENSYYHVLGMWQGKYRLRERKAENMDDTRSLPLEELEFKIKTFIKQQESR